MDPGVAVTAPTVLVADDQEFVRELIAELLEQAGYRVLQAGDGAEAIRMIHADRPGLVVMDVIMPVMDGLAATRKLKADPATASIPILVLTGDQAEATRENALAAGCNTYMAKPLNPMAFVSLVNHWLRR
jgi:CheY-like chemotaxis protein